jgi:uncharacterized membrane protein YoaK (UPF0700 family)
MSDSTAHPRTTASLLAFTAGFVDTCGFIALFGLFTAHVTGNFVVIGAAFVHGGAGLIAKIAALPTFVSVIVLARLVEQHLQRRGRSSSVVLLSAQLLLLTLFMVLGLFATPINDMDKALPITAALVGVAAMALQNAASRGVFANLSPTTVMTGNVTQMTLDAVDLFTHYQPEQRSVLAARFAKMWPPVLWFAVGAAASALGTAWFGFICLLAPILALLVALLLTQRT